MNNGVISNLKYRLKNGSFVFTSELGPPKGVLIDELKIKTDMLKEFVTAVNVSDLQGSNLSLNSLSVSHILSEFGLEPVMQITCRDRNRLALQSDILSAYILNIRNILCLTGDYITIGDHPSSKPVFDLDSVTLLYAIKKMEEGFDMAGNELKAKPRFFKGAAVNPEADTDTSFELQLIKMKKKVDCGAEFFQTMPVFNTSKFKVFIDRIKKLDIKVPVIAGIQLIKSEKMANYMNKYIPGITVSDWIIKKIAEAENKADTSIKIAAEIINEIKPFCSGIHIGAQGWEQYIPVLLEKIEGIKK
ncbi:MAG: methylenetetrahydrofolate reductase [Actinobacteria bacterium]|nr:methylenetetrahydrofolate reductase [Actinomycetota bacterium]